MRQEHEADLINVPSIVICRGSGTLVDHNGCEVTMITPRLSRAADTVAVRIRA
jgi:hypothetical protein